MLKGTVEPGDPVLAEDPIDVGPAAGQRGVNLMTQGLILFPDRR